MTKRIAFVGVGHRATRFIDELAGPGRPAVQLVGFCDASQARMAAQNRWLQEKHGLAPVPVFRPDGFAEMVRSTRPHVIVVATVDSLHHEYIIRSLELGCDVITEKPMTIDAEKCRLILAAAARHRERRITVAFNYRWAPTNARVKELLAAGAIGTVRSVNLEWLLDLRHGADYFRRWHSEKRCSGGLLVHKATHHFDLVNWWTNALPEQVYASGGLQFYGRDNAVARGLERLTRYPRYTGSAAAADDPFALDLAANPRFRALYLEAEAETGYIRDRNIFREGIDIEDQASVIVRYRNGMLLTYTLNAFSPREGMRAVFNGDRGRLEYYQFDKTHTGKPENDEGHEGAPDENGTRLLTEQTFIRVYPHHEPAYNIPAVAGPGGHWGGDPLMIRHLFSEDAPADPLGRVASHEQGAASLLVGAAANESLATGAPVLLSRLLNLRPYARHLHELA
ncbi:MAG TPA: Gfo/Idh/MocA family oxidoreductase [Lacunisphaera sp.]